MKVDELFDRCYRLATAQPSATALRQLHETLVLACGEALHDTPQAFGNLFSQVDFLCRYNGIATAERIAIQQMRRHSNGHADDADWTYDVRALSRFVSAVFHADIPHDLLVRLPADYRPSAAKAVNLRYIRCVVDHWDDSHVYASTADGPVSIAIGSPRTTTANSHNTTASDHPGNATIDSLRELLTEGLQLNLLDCRREGTTIQPGLIVVEPDFLVDISSIAACFQDYGHHPLAYLVGRLKPRANSQQILLGNFAGAALDDLIHHPDTFRTADTLRQSFRDQALQFCTCDPFDGQRFKDDAQRQVGNISQAVALLFNPTTATQTPSPATRHPSPTYDRRRALLEPSFVCERLGLQGRVDLMTDDMRLLVEQKSGKSWNIDRLMQHLPPVGQHLYTESHYVQLLLYYGVLRYNFQLPADRVDIRLLYSRYPARQGLVVTTYYHQLFCEAIAVRNRIVATERQVARRGFASVAPQLRAGVLLQDQRKADFFNKYIRPDIEPMLQSLRNLSAAEADYVERMLTFVYREQLAQKTGVQEGQTGAQADLWNMPLSEKLETGCILMGPVVGHDSERVTLSIDTSTVLPNFRRGDMVYLYRYTVEPDVTKSILYKGVVERLTDTETTILLNNRQQNAAIFREGTFAVEHASSDVGTSSAVRAVMAFCQASQEKRDLLLGLRPPRRDASAGCSRSYHPYYDDVLLKACQAQDYFLLQGPPGTGKTSLALRYLVEEALARLSTLSSGGSILLTAYTHRAVDEICSMLGDAHIDYVRLGSPTSCDPRYASHLLDSLLDSHPRLSDIRQVLSGQHVVVGTTSTLQARPFIFQLKHFRLCIVDEASQILEPSIIGLLASKSIDRFILIGDHKQLPAVVQQPDDEPRLHDCRLSLFERLLRQEQQAGRTDFTAVLRRQGRMHPDIARFANEHFYRRERLLPVPLPHQEATATLGYDQPSADTLDDLLKQRRVLFFDRTAAGLTSEPTATAGNTEAATSDKANATEARMVARLLERIYRLVGADAFDPQHTVGVIVPYRNQIAMIRHEVSLLGIDALGDISIDTVERYQGSQRDVIVYSFTVQHAYQLDFLTANSFEEDGQVVDRKLNVAMTRARKQLIMTGCSEVLSKNALFAELIREFHADYNIKN